MDQDRADHEILQCVDRTLEAFRPGAKHFLYWQMLTTFNARPSELVDHPELLSNALANVFGQESHEIEKELVKEIKARFQIKRSESIDLLHALRKAREQAAVLVFTDITG